MKHKFIAKRYWKDMATPMGQVDALAKQFDNVIDLSLGDPDLVTDSLIIQKAFEDTKLGHTKYTEFRGDPELREEIRKFYKNEYKMAVEDEEIMVVTGGSHGMYLALESVLDDNDEVIIHAPYFTPYPQQIRLARGIPVVLNTYEEENFLINISRLEELITERTKAIIINTPNNPTGACFNMETLEGIARLAKKHDLLVIADDIYPLYSYEEPFIPISSLEGMKERTITVNSFSKDYTMTGWRIGYIIAPKELIRTMQQVNENVVFTAPSVSQRAAIHALRNRKTIQGPMLEEYKKRIFHTAKLINNTNNMSTLPPRGTFYLFSNIKGTGLSSSEVCDLMLREAQVLTIPGTAFGDCGEGYIRIACTVSIEKIEEAFMRIGKMNIFSKGQ